jgi:signal transduction histidine kinase
LSFEAKDYTMILTKNIFDKNFIKFISIAIILSISLSVFYSNETVSNNLLIDRQFLDNFSKHFEDGVINEINLINSIMIHEWLTTNGQNFSYSSFLDIAPGYFHYLNILIGLNWINSSGFINWVYPFTQNELAINKSVVFYPFNSTMLNDGFFEANNCGCTSITKILTFIQGGFGFAAYVPVYVNNSLKGFLNPLFNLNALINYSLTHDYPSISYDVEVFDDSFFTNNVNLQKGFIKPDGTNSIYYSLNILNQQFIIKLTTNDHLFFNFTKNFLLITSGQLIMLFFIRIIAKDTDKKNIKKGLHLEPKPEEFQNYHNLINLGIHLSKISHDFKNIFSNLNNTILLIELEYFPKLTHEIITTELINNVSTSINSLSRNFRLAQKLSEDLLNYSRNKDTSEFDFIELRVLIDDCISTIEEHTNKHVNFTIQNLDGLIVFGNKTWLSQVFNNLFSNSIDAFQDMSGDITIYYQYSADNDHNSITNVFKRINRSIRFSKMNLILNIRDNGIGMDKDQLVNAFKPFYSKKQSTLGTGLGLTIVRDNLSSMGCKINIISELSKFTLIQIELPIILKIN